MEAAIVIPSYNYEGYLAEAIESALAQTVPCEVFVVDDGSTDGSLAIAQRYQDEITLLQQENRGVSAARNRAIELATADHILPLDADDVLFPAAVEGLLSLPYGLRMGVMQVFGEGRYQVDCKPNTPSLHDMVHQCRMWQTTMYPRQAWVDVGGYDEDIPHWAFEDWDFWVRCMAAGYELHTTNEVRSHKFRRHGYSLTQVGNDHGDEIRDYLHTKWKGMGIE